MEADEARRIAGSTARDTPPWVTEGSDLSRTLALSDGIFAFAMTLLVLGIVLPLQFTPQELGTVLAKLQPAFLTYVLSFFVIFFYWMAHHQIFTYIRRYDRRLLSLNAGFLLFIALMPFVTNLVSAAPGAFLTVLVYAGAQATAGAILLGLWTYASMDRRLVSSTMPGSWIRYIRLRTMLTPIVFGASIPIAAWDPGIAEYSWIAVFVLQIIVRRRGSAPQSLEGSDPPRTTAPAPPIGAASPPDSRS